MTFVTIQCFYSTCLCQAVLPSSASIIDAATNMSQSSDNAAALDDFLGQPVQPQMVRYLARQTSLIVRRPPPTSVSVLTPVRRSHQILPPLELFIHSVVHNSSVTVATLMTSLVYLARLRTRLSPRARYTSCAGHRIFLASLIVAAKSVNDSSPRNRQWTRYTTIRGYRGFTLRLSDVNLMERQLLALLEWNIRVSEHDLYEHLEPFLAPIRQSSWGPGAAKEQARWDTVSTSRSKQFNVVSSQVLATSRCRPQILGSTASEGKSRRMHTINDLVYPPDRLAHTC